MKVPLLVVAAWALLRLPAAYAQEATSAGEHLGEVTFSTSCSDAVQPQFNRAVALMHSFQFGPAINGFHSILASDPTCAMAYWGIALSEWGNPFSASLRPHAQLERGSEAVEQARAAGAKTARERGYIEAVAQLYGDKEHRNQRARMLAYEHSMAGVSASHPEDTEAAIFYALALAAASDPADKTYANQLKAGAILERLFAQYPDHPGLAHYLIHTYDVPSLAGRASEATRRYSAIAPSTPHALHMPSHTYTRLGDWKASIQANTASAASARAAGQPADELHASDYLIYAYLQTGQDEAARRVVTSAEEIFGRFDPTATSGGAAGPPAAYFARAAIPARYCLERHDWEAAARLEVHPSPTLQADAITYFARGLGAAHGKDRAGARSALDSLVQIRDTLKLKGEDYWSNQVEIQRREVAAWIVYMDGDTQGALTAMRAAAAEEDMTEKNVVTPGPLAPARELLAELLMELKQPVKARDEFEATLQKEPNRLLSLYGAAQAAKMSGDEAGEQKYFQKLLEIAGEADRPGRLEIADARRQLLAD